MNFVQLKYSILVVLRSNSMKDIQSIYEEYINGNGNIIRIVDVYCTSLEANNILRVGHIGMTKLLRNRITISSKL
jgi:hypothetical protein